MKFSGRKLYAPGFCRKNHKDQWEYSPAAVLIIQRFINLFPELVSELEKNPNADVYDGESVFKEKWTVKLEELKYFLSAIPIAKVPLLSTDCETVDRKVIDQFEQLGSEFSKRTFSTKIISGIKRPAFLSYKNNPVDLIPNSKFTLGDRVIFIGYSNAFGLRGTVFSIENDFLEIVFDMEVIGGSNMQGRVRGARGMRAEKSQVLNLSRPNLERTESNAPPSLQEQEQKKKMISSNPFAALLEEED